MHRSLIVSFACLTILVAGCGGDDKSAPEGSGSGSGSGSSSGKMSDNVCEAVAPAVPKDWGLTETSAEPGEPNNHCTLADKAGHTHLVVTLRQPKSGSVNAAYDELCDKWLGGNPQEQDEERCTLTGPIKLEGSPAQLGRGVRLDSPAAVLWLTFQTNDPDVASEVEDVLEDVESAVSGD